MSVFTSFQHTVPLSGSRSRTRPRSRSLRAAVAQVFGRLVDSPLDSPVLRLVPPPGPEHPGPRLSARWHATTAADGATRLTCHWHADH